MKVAILGAGSWGTALSMVLARAGHAVRLWARESEIAYHINNFHENSIYLTGVTLADTIVSDTEIEDSLKDAELVVFAIPSHAMREIAERARKYLRGDEVIVNVAKGIENNTFMTMSQVLVEALDGKIIEDHIGTLSGPSHAEEVSKFKPTVVTASAYSRSTSHLIQKTFMTPMFRVYVNHDILGVEIAGSVKNIIAIDAGIIDGLDLGDNSKAALLTRGLSEMRRLGTRLGASTDTFSGLAGLGDLIVTCTSRHSRNRHVGYHLGKGEKLDDIISHMKMVAEGVKTTRSVYFWAKELNVEMPLTNTTYQILFENMDPKDAVYELMTRNPKEEILS